MGLKEVYKVWANIYKSPKYILIAFFISFIFYAFNIFILNWDFIPLQGQGATFFGGALDFLFMLFSKPIILKLYSFIGVIVISLLFGFLFSLVFYKVNFFKDSSEKKSGLFGIMGSGVFGAFAGIFATGCAACGVGLVSILGISAGFLSIFPYHGFEFTLISIFILVFAIIKISKNMYFCNLKKKN